MKKVINRIAWLLAISIPVGAIVYGIIQAVKDFNTFICKAIDLTVVGFVVFALFGLLGIIIKTTEKNNK